MLNPPGEKDNISSANDILSLLFRSTRRTSAKDLWARSVEGYKELEHSEMLKLGWVEGMGRGATFPLQMRVRSALFNELTEEEQAEWNDKALQTKDLLPSK
jgi:hypothetical protein